MMRNRSCGTTLRENDIQWRQIFSGKRWMDDPLAQQYEITGVPEQWLIDRDGKLITHKARGEDLERLVAGSTQGQIREPIGVYYNLSCHLLVHMALRWSARSCGPRFLFSLRSNITPLG